MEFDAAADAVKTLPVAPDNDTLLELYALYKQATHGDCDTARPGMFDLKGKAKWDAWDKKRGTSKDAARAAYVDLVTSLLQKHNLPVPA